MFHRKKNTAYTVVACHKSAFMLHLLIDYLKARNPFRLFSGSCGFSKSLIYCRRFDVWFYRMRYISWLNLIADNYIAHYCPLSLDFLFGNPSFYFRLFQIVNTTVTPNAGVTFPATFWVRVLLHLLESSQIKRQYKGKWYVYLRKCGLTLLITVNNDQIN